MSVLSYEEICDLIEDGVILNAKYENVNAASLDVTLAPLLLIESPTANVVNLGARTPLEFIPNHVPAGGIHILRPMDFLLASTQEVFNLPCNIAAEYKLKSSMARVGLEHLNAGWCDPGWNGSSLTLELKNVTQHHSIAIKPGDKIGQIIFYRCRPVPLNKSYATRGSYNGDLFATPSKEKA